MNQASFDPGFSQQISGGLRRSINADGSFNVHRKGIRERDIYKSLIGTSWPRFIAVIVASFFVVNLMFASLYLAIGIEHLKGAHHESPMDEYWSAFFFSVHTLTTVGYGSMYPDGIAANIVSALEAMTGLMGFALGTGLLYGRFSRPRAKILFSRTAVIAPYQQGSALMFRIANGRTNVLMEIEATMILMTVGEVSMGAKRSYAILPLERAKTYFLPLTWTIVHPIDEASPLHGKSMAELAATQAEVLILVKAFDDTFSQTVHARHSYRFDEMEWAAKYTPIFEVDSHGDVLLHVDRLDETTPAALS